MVRISQRWIPIVILLLINSIRAQFDIVLPVSPSSDRFQSQISLQNKQVYGTMDEQFKLISISWRLTQKSAVNPIIIFLSNPFFQINEYTCPADQSGFKASPITLPSIGIMEMNHTIIQYPQCSKGRLGLSKLSTFLNYLPINDHTIKFEINRKDGPYNSKIAISFGQVNTNLDKAWRFSSNHNQYWDIQAKSIDFGPLTFELSPKIIFTSIGSSIKIPNQFYEKLMTYFPTNQTCKVINQKLFCLCESGIPIFFPKIYVNLQNSEKLIIPPELYMSIDSNICTMLFESSSNNYWYFNVAFFQNTIFYFDRNNGSVIIQKKEQIRNQSSELIHLPIQLILNCAVVLLLCIFASLVLIQIIKRISSLPETREGTVRQYMIQQNLLDT